MTAPKDILGYGALFAIEASYGGGVVLADATHGLGHLVDLPEVNIDYAHPGDRSGRTGGNAARTRRVAKSGRFGEFTLPVEAACPGVAYSATRFPSVHNLLRALGLGVTTVTTGGSESHTYAPTAFGVARASGALRVYKHGQRFDAVGVLGATLVIEAESGEVPRWTVTLRGIMSSGPVDITLPVITYGGANREAELALPPKFEAGLVQIGTWTPLRVQSFRHTLELNLTPRRLDNSTGAHGGFTPGIREVSTEVTVEAGPLASLDPYQLEASQTVLTAFQLQVGSTQYNRWRIGAPTLQTAQIREVEDAADGNTAMWALTIDHFPSTPTANDEISYVFN